MKQILKDRLYLDDDDIEHMIYIFDCTEIFSWGDNLKVVCIFSALKGHLNIHKYLNTKIIKKLYDGNIPQRQKGLRTPEMLSINFLAIDKKDPSCYEKIKYAVFEMSTKINRGFNMPMNLDVSMNLGEKIKNFIKRTT